MAGGARGAGRGHTGTRVLGTGSGCTAFGLTALSCATLEDVPGDSQVTQSDPLVSQEGEAPRALHREA